MNAEHLGSAGRDGLRGARGRRLHDRVREHDLLPRPHHATGRSFPASAASRYGPKRFFYYSLFESDRTGAPIAVRNRAEGSVDAYAAAVGRWLVTRDGFDFLVYYLPGLRLRLARARPGHGRRGARAAATTRSARCLRRRAAWTSSSSATPSSSSPTTDRRTSSAPSRLQDAFADFRLFSRRSATRSWP